jgi:hypothetical protein
MQMKTKRINVDAAGKQCSAKDAKRKEMRDVYTRVKATVKDVSELPKIAMTRGFIRWCTGNMQIGDVVARRQAEGRSDWYV